MIWVFFLSCCCASLLNYGAAEHNLEHQTLVDTYLRGNFEHETSGNDFKLMASENAINEIGNPASKYTAWKDDPTSWGGVTDISGSGLGKARCTIWGSGNILTLDKDMYFFSGTCNYIFVRIGQDSPPEIFNVQYQRMENGTMRVITILIGPHNIVVQGPLITINDQRKTIPYSNNGIQIMKYGSQTSLIAKQQDLEVSLFWDTYSLSVEIDRKYANQTSGMCGNFNGEHLDEFKEEGGKLLFPYQYAVNQQIDGPGVTCPFKMSDSRDPPTTRYVTNCKELLDLVSTSCTVPKANFLGPCQRDLYYCSTPGMRSCVCATLSQYSSQCANSMQPVKNWRSASFCPIIKCPSNQVYNESGLPCIATCTNPQYTCPPNQPGVYGCYCPEGTVLDDVSGTGNCVPVEECPCKINEQIYSQNETTTNECQTCQCLMGQWKCSDENCPGRCSIDSGSEVTSFDNKIFQFHGVCEYVLLSSHKLPHNGTLLAKFESCGVSSSETCLTSLTYAIFGDTLEPTETIVLSSQDHLIVNSEITPLPYITDGLIVFRASSTHMVLYSDFGLEVVIQRFPVFSVYLTVQSSYGGSTKGLCGNFNKDTNDDFMSSSGIPEGSVTVFVDSWRASPNPHLCTAAQNKDINPCSMSVSNELCAETHCSELLRAQGVFAMCHSMVDPEPYYKRCVYAGCNYQETYAFICESLGSYARMCASKAVFIGDWRTSTNCTVPCTGNQTFSYNTEACGRTCQSLSNRQYECYTPDIPLDGCNCPDGYYLDHLSKCVKSSQCPCYLPDNIILLPNYKSTIDGRTCYCMNGKLNCFGKPSTGAGVCNAPMEYKTCGTGAQKWGAACAPSCQMKATGIRCIPTRCEAGCVCPAGLLEDLDGKCVDPDDCSCEYGGNIYPTGNVMQKDCQSCLCTGGQWKCTENLKCASTCVLYGEGHVNTFDGQQFVFDGNCEYALVTDGCGVNNSLSTFKIVTENVVCGRLGVTCSRAIRISTGATVLQLSEEDYTITPNVHDPNIRVSKNNLFMTFDITIPGRFIISLLWNKNMNVFIKLFKLQQDAICGLCGNYNGNQKDDYETRSKYVAPNMLSFVNSWKENPLCGDVNYVVDPCSKNPYRSVWAQKNCAIINSKTFAPCHSLEYQGPYYEACLHDACGCDSGGDCECLCDAIAAYAKKCLDKGVCIDWRRPDFCPVYCDYENTHTQVGTSNTYVYSGDVNCTWHYQPCQCPFTPHSYPLSNTEGCYKCTPEQYYNPEEGKCVPCVPLSTSTTAPVTTPVTTATVTTPTTPVTTATVTTPVTTATVTTPVTTTTASSTKPVTESTETTSVVTSPIPTTSATSLPTTTTTKSPTTTPTTSPTTVPTTSAESTPTETLSTATETSPTEIVSTSEVPRPSTASTPTTTTSTQTTTATESTPVTPSPTSSPTTASTVPSTTSTQTTTETESTPVTPSPTSSPTTASTFPSTASSTITTQSVTHTTSSTQTPATSTTTKISTTETSMSTTFEPPQTVTAIKTTPKTLPVAVVTTPAIPSTETSTTLSSTSASSTKTVAPQTTPIKTTHRTPSTGKDESITTGATTVPQVPCNVHQYEHNVTKDGCSEVITLTTCEGLCSSQAWYDDKLEVIKGRCGCCMPVIDTIITKAIQLTCPNSKQVVIVNIKIFQECTCNHSVCTQT